MININATTFLVIINFLFLVFLLKIILFDPLLTFLNERSKAIKESMDKSEESRSEADKLLGEQKEELQKARIEARSIIEHSVSEAQKESKEIMKRAHEEATREKESVRQELLREAERIKKGLRQEIASFSVLLAEKIIEKEIDQKKHMEIIDKNLKELEA